MIEVTDEMRHVGGEMLRKCREMEVFHEQAADAAYRAMRALEPKPVDRVERPVFKFDDPVPAFVVNRAAHRRLDALQALVLVLAARSQGYPPGDATLTRLIAELENAR